ncbi:hypothetical protein CHLRE_14g618979v5 [Chlamydomonas reinhardtii]|uniref:phytol kinase n=1 Tax=Chlamydomonas reinhardtii TaxID=3055 RepID=A0A2K3CXU4_CHLRE|nr:uncharacterized protein CHLRE_14g618979v5 [Chlamydomonas reinhardtii]PNW73106.1 hypothetical protein CHLRE_14g618979v5 [Chlamydomonas reinhardtii]
MLSAYARIAAAAGRQQPRGLSAADGSTNGSSSGSSSSNGDGGDSNSNRGKGEGDRGGEGTGGYSKTQAQLHAYAVMISTALIHDLILAADQTCGFAELLTALERTQLLEHQAGAILRLASAPASASAAGRQAAAQTAAAAAAAADATFAALAMEEGAAPGGSPQQAGGSSSSTGGSSSSGLAPAVAAVVAARPFIGLVSRLVWPPSNGPVSLERLAPAATGAAAGPLAAAVAAPAAAAGRSRASSGHGSSSGCVGQGGSSSSSASDGSSSVRPAEHEATAAPSPSPAAERAEAFYLSELPRVRSLLSGPCVQLLLAWVWACVQKSVTATNVAGGAQTAAAGSGSAAAAAAGAASAAAGGARGAADLLDWRQRRRITQNPTSPPLPLPQPMRQTLRLPRELPVRPVVQVDALPGAGDGSGIDDNRQRMLKRVMQMAVGVINVMQVTVGGGGAPRRRRSGLGSSSPAAAAAAVAASDLAATAPQQPQQPQQLQPQPAAPSRARRDSGGGGARAATPVAAATLPARHAYSLLLTTLPDFVLVAAPAPPLQGLLSVGSHVLLRLLTELPPRQAAARLPGLWQLLVRLLPVELEEVMCEAVGRALQLQTQPVGFEGPAALGQAAAQLPQRAAVAAAPAAPQRAVAAAAAATAPAVAAAAGPCYSLRCALDAGLLPALERALRNPAAWPPPNPSARHEGEQPPQLNDLVHAVFQGSCAVPALLAHGDLADAASLVATLGAAARTVLCPRSQQQQQQLDALFMGETAVTAGILIESVVEQLCAALDMQVAKPTRATPGLASASLSMAMAARGGGSSDGSSSRMAGGGSPGSPGSTSTSSGSSSTSSNTTSTSSGSSSTSCRLLETHGRPTADQEAAPAEGLALIAALGGAPPPGSPAAAQQALLASFGLQQWLPVLIFLAGHCVAADVLMMSHQAPAVGHNDPSTQVCHRMLFSALRPATRVMLAVAAAAGEPSGEAAAAVPQGRMDAWRRVMLQPCASAVQRLVVMMVLLAQQGDAAAAAAVTIPPELEAAMLDLITAYLAVCGPELGMKLLYTRVPPMQVVMSSEAVAAVVPQPAGGPATAATGGGRGRARAGRAGRGGSSSNNSSSSSSSISPAAATPPTQEMLVGSWLVMAALRQGSRGGAFLTYMNWAGRAQLLSPSQAAAAAAAAAAATAAEAAARPDNGRRRSSPAAAAGTATASDGTAAAARAPAAQPSFAATAVADMGTLLVLHAEAALQLRRVLLRDPAWQRRYGPPMSWLLSPVEMEVRLRRGGVVPGGGAWCCDGEARPMVSGGGVGGSGDGGGNSSGAGAAAAQGSSGGDDCVLLCGNPDCCSLDGPSALIPPGGGKLCSRCKAVRYCCGACQLAHWREGGHSAACARMAAAVAAAPAGPVADTGAA